MKSAGTVEGVMLPVHSIVHNSLWFVSKKTFPCSEHDPEIDNWRWKQETKRLKGESQDS